MNSASVAKPRARALSLWGVLGGFVGSFCCLGPSTAVLLGLGSSSLLFSLQFDRSWTFAVGAAVLLGGIVRVLWRGQADGLCSVARWRQPLIMAATFAVSYGLLGWLLPMLAAQKEDRDAALSHMVVAPVRPAPPVLHRLTLIIEKMNCPPCAAKVRNRLQNKPAVRELRAEAYDDQVIITYDPRQTTKEELIKIFPRDYGVSFVRDEPLP
ncbi:MAG TPA: heavy-metal-associated domain-containing protein [Herpetosiphonaceae bacterium]